MVRTRMPGGVGGVVSRGAPLSRFFTLVSQAMLVALLDIAIHLDDDFSSIARHVVGSHQMKKLLWR